MFINFDLFRKIRKYIIGGTWFDFIQFAVLLLAIIFPLIVITAFPKLYHTSDVRDLWQWSQFWGSNWRNIYVDCSKCNYPFLGTFLSAGVMSLSGIHKLGDIVMPFRYYLGIVDGVNIIIIYWMLKKLQVQGAPFWAGIIGLLPSSWIGSSVWGQIDGIGLTLILLIFVLFISFNFEGKSGLVKYYFFVFTAGLLISLSLLFKQLIIFSLLSVGYMSALNIFLYSRRLSRILVSFLLLLFSIVATILLIDLNLNLPLPFVSHLQYIWETGSRQGDIISSFGFNIWIFFTKRPFGSSHSAISIGLNPNLSIPVVPYKVGMALFLLTTVALSAYFLKYLFGRYFQGGHFLDRELILGFLFHLSLVNLSFNLFLTGTHERYLFYFYPFLIMTFLGLENYGTLFSRKSLYVLVAGAIFYGLVLYVYLIGAIKPFGQIPFQALSIFHITLFIYLVILFVKYFKPRQV